MRSTGFCIDVRIIGYYFHYAAKAKMVSKIKRHTAWVEPKSQVLLVILKQ